MNGPHSRAVVIEVGGSHAPSLPGPGNNIGVADGVRLPGWLNFVGENVRGSHIQSA
jgi:hypothetical protein